MHSFFPFDFRIFLSILEVNHSIPSLHLFLVPKCINDTLGDASFTGIPFAFLASRNYCPISVLFGDLCLHVNGLCFRMYERRIAVAAAAALEEAGATRIRGGNGFPMDA